MSEVTQETVVVVLTEVAHLKEQVEIDRASIETVVSDTKQTVTTIVEDSHEVVEKGASIAKQFTEEQEEILKSLMAEASMSAHSIMELDVGPAGKIAKLMAEAMKLVESAKKKEGTLLGPEKKALVMELVQRVLKKVVEDRDKLFELLAAYNNMGEHLLETLADVSRDLNSVKDKVSSCCVIV
jgi:hypothetical protein